MLLLFFWIQCVCHSYTWVPCFGSSVWLLPITISPKFIFTHARPLMAISNVISFSLQLSFQAFAVSPQVLWLLSCYKLFVCERAERLRKHGFDLNLFDSLNPDSINLRVFRKADRRPRESSVTYTPVDFLGRCHLSEVWATSSSLQWQQPTSRVTEELFSGVVFSAVNNKNSFIPSLAWRKYQNACSKPAN